eukprot:4280154-Amphidinium_carterae.1
MDSACASVGRRSGNDIENPQLAQNGSSARAHEKLPDSHFGELAASPTELDNKCALIDLATDSSSGKTPPSVRACSC